MHLILCVYSYFASWLTPSCKCFACSKILSVCIIQGRKTKAVLRKEVSPGIEYAFLIRPTELRCSSVPRTDHRVPTSPLALYSLKRGVSDWFASPLSCSLVFCFRIPVYILSLSLTRQWDRSSTRSPYVWEKTLASCRASSMSLIQARLVVMTMRPSYIYLTALTNTHTTTMPCVVCRSQSLPKLYTICVYKNRNFLAT